MSHIWKSTPLLALRMSLGILLRTPEGLRRQVSDKLLSTACKGTIGHLEALSHGYLFGKHCKGVMILERATISTAL